MVSKNKRFFFLSRLKVDDQDGEEDSFINLADPVLMDLFDE